MKEKQLALDERMLCSAASPLSSSNGAAFGLYAVSMKESFQLASREGIAATSDRPGSHWLYVRMTKTEHLACRTIVLALEPIR
jgi:hypothetical protein